ncbi:Hypothetical predicted protein [Cloeon dipterum]|uniref:Uncharacterized protein n=1 Tax=Cloeon dipterum TaxID=197152 RepID=A0A8S1CVX3_9INSE|nr:Hypothetical predicted protein [Cloeon dipterum]
MQTIVHNLGCMCEKQRPRRPRSAPQDCITAKNEAKERVCLDSPGERQFSGKIPFDGTPAATFIVLSTAELSGE